MPVTEKKRNGLLTILKKKFIKKMSLLVFFLGIVLIIITAEGLFKENTMTEVN